MDNEESGCYEWKEVETDKYDFEETDKTAIVREYLQTQLEWQFQAAGF